jgi:hypothetical protein
MDWSLLFPAFLTWSAVHFIGDFAFQSAWMALMKSPLQNDGKVDSPNEVLLYHCLTYTATFVVFAKVFGTSANPLAFLAIFLAHLVVDYHKARKIVVKTIWLDQLLHLLTLLPLIWIGWLPP